MTRNRARARLDPVRLVAWQTLRAVAEDDAYANLVLPVRLRRAGLTGRDAAFATELGYGTLRGLGTYDAVLAQCLDRPPDQVDPPLLDALRLGVHQLLATRVPAHAAVASTVDLVRSEVGQGAAGFANAVLRRVAETDRDGWLARIVPDDAGQDTRLALVHSHPEWIVRALRDALRTAGRDPGELADLLVADNTPAAVTLVALPGLCEVAELVEQAGAQPQGSTPRIEPGSLSPYAVRIGGDPARLPAVTERRARVQDEGSQVVTLDLADAPLDGPDGGLWLDLCAGPGGKTALLAALHAVRRLRGELPVQARPVANEVAPHRAALVRAALADPDAAVLRTGDGRDVAALSALAPGGYDRVLLDAPCTGLGALRRRPEARWRRRPADVGALGILQRDLLRAALELARPGGVVAYVTCSPHPAETHQVVGDLLRGCAAGAPSAVRLGGPTQLWPHIDGCDAMFLCLLRRTGAAGSNRPPG